MHNRSVVYHISSSVDIHARISVRQTVFLLCQDRSERLYPHPLQICRRKVFLLSAGLCRLQTVQTEDHSYVRHSHHLHRMQVQCVRYLYRLTWLHSCHMSQRSPSCSVYLPFPLRRHITVHILCIPDLFLCRFPEFHMPCCHFLRSPVWKIKQYPEELLPCSKYSRQQLLLLRIPHPGLRREPRYLAMSMVLLSMPGNTHLLPLP